MRRSRAPGGIGVLVPLSAEAGRTAPRIQQGFRRFTSCPHRSRRRYARGESTCETSTPRDTSSSRGFTGHSACALDTEPRESPCSRTLAIPPYGYSHTRPRARCDVVYDSHINPAPLNPSYRYYTQSVPPRGRKVLKREYVTNPTSLSKHDSIGRDCATRAASADHSAGLRGHRRLACRARRPETARTETRTTVTIQPRTGQADLGSPRGRLPFVAAQHSQQGNPCEEIDLLMREHDTPNSLTYPSRDADCTTAHNVTPVRPRESFDNVGK